MEAPARLGREKCHQRGEQRGGVGSVAAEQHTEAEKRELATALALVDVNVRQAAGAKIVRKLKRGKANANSHRER